MADHPITPPQELVNQWRKRAPVARDGGATREQWIASQAARWGDDQRLEACEKWMHVQHLPGFACQLHAAMRPKPPSLKEQAISDLSHLSDAEFHALCPQGEHAPGPEPLSPAAQAIVAAMHRSYDHEPTRRATAAAILRALADAVVPEETGIVQACEFRLQRQWTREQILSIATDLETTDD